MNILALDLGKYKTVFCDYNPANGEHEFGKVNTTPKDIHDLLVAREPQTVTFEVCTLAGWIFDITKALGIKTEAANPMHDAWRRKNVKKKTDKEDALKLAKLSCMGQLPTVHMPKKDVREKRALTKYRQRLVSQKTTIKNTIRAIFSRQGIAMKRGRASWSKEGLEWLKRHARAFGKIFDAEQSWRGQLHTELGLLETVTKALKKVERKLNKMGSTDKQIRRLQTIKGVGPRLAETVVAFIDDPKRFKNAKQVGSYAGLVPKQYQSGQSERQGKTGGRGNKLLRNLLIEICWASLASNKWARDNYKRLLRGSTSRKKIAITALARKLVVQRWAMLRDEQDWNDNIQKNVA